MAAIPYMPMFWSDYLADTAYLTTLEHGAYILLIANYWQTGKPLPYNDVYLARICKVSVDKFSKMKSVLKNYFQCQNSSLVHPRIEQELEKVREKSNKSRTSAQKRWESKSCERIANALPSLCHTDPEADTDQEKDQKLKTPIVVFSPQQAAGQKLNDVVDEEIDEIAIRIIKRGKTYGVGKKKMGELSEIYPGVDVLNEFKKMNLWLQNNPAKQSKTVRGVNQRINTWLANAMERQQRTTVIDEKFQEEIKTVFREILPENPINFWSSQAAKDLQARIDSDPRMKKINWWRNFFLFVKCSSGISIRERHLDYIVRELKFSDIMNLKRSENHELEKYEKVKSQYSTTEKKPDANAAQL